MTTSKKKRMAKKMNPLFKKGLGITATMPFMSGGKETMKDMGGNNGRIATAADRRKDPYLSSDSRIYSKIK